MTFAVVLSLLVLSVFRWIENRVPTQAYYYFDVKYAREGNLSEEAMAPKSTNSNGNGIRRLSGNAPR